MITDADVEPVFATDAAPRIWIARASTRRRLRIRARRRLCRVRKQRWSMLLGRVLCGLLRGGWQQIRMIASWLGNAAHTYRRCAICVKAQTARGFRRRDGLDGHTGSQLRCSGLRRGNWFISDACISDGVGRRRRNMWIKDEAGDSRQPQTQCSACPDFDDGLFPSPCELTKLTILKPGTLAYITPPHVLLTAISVESCSVFVNQHFTQHPTKINQRIAPGQVPSASDSNCQ